MNIKKNKLQIFKPNNKSFTFIAIILAILLITSALLQVILILNKLHTPLVIVDSILLTILLITYLLLLLKCKFSTVTIKKEVIIVKNMAFSTKIISYEDIKSIEQAAYSSNNKLNEIWGDYIYVYDNDDTLLFKFSFDQKAFDLINEKLNKNCTKQDQKNDESYGNYYNKMKSQNI